MEMHLSGELTQILLLLAALVLSAIIGLERQILGKSAGIRTQAIVGMTAALMMLISKYGFSDVLSEGIVRVDPSRVAAQVVSGIGFLGAGIILTRHGAIRGLTTAATIWETAAIGMACGAGLWWLALAGTVFHFVVIWVLSPFARLFRRKGSEGENILCVSYPQGEGVLRSILSELAREGWSVENVSTSTSRSSETLTAYIRMHSRVVVDQASTLATLADLPNVQGVRIMEDNE